MSIFQQIALAVWRWLTPRVEGILDPHYKAELEKLRADEAAQAQKVKEAEDAIRASEAAYQTSVNHRQELDRLIQISEQQENESQQRLTESQLRVKQIEDELAANKKRLDDLTGGDRVRVDL